MTIGPDSSTSTIVWETTTFGSGSSPPAAQQHTGTSTICLEQSGDTAATLVATVAGTIVAVATAERIAPQEAEVAFLVADSEHGRGLGSLLLEHLAATCRDLGVRRFVAEVLPRQLRTPG